MTIPSIRRRARAASPRLAVADMGGGEYELTLYGDVMAAETIDWWTGEHVDTPAVTAEAVNRELDELRRADHVTVRLNSCGGDLYAGLAIYEVLRSLSAEVTVRIEGIAASAASVIACAGDRVVVGPGSILMVHEGSLALFGYYTGADVRALASDMDAGVRAMLGVYSSKTGRDAEELRPLVEAETWMVGQEIVDAGFADELDDHGSTSDGEVSDGEDGETVIAGVAHDLRRFRHVPDLAAMVAASARRAQAPVAAAAALDTDKPPQAAPEEKGETFMNISELRDQHPDLVAEIEAAAAQGERDRLAAIDEVAAGAPADMVREAKYGEARMSAADFALAALRAQGEARAAAAEADRQAAARHLADAQQDSDDSGTGDVDPEPSGAGGDDEVAEAKEEVRQCAELRARMRGGR